MDKKIRTNQIIFTENLKTAKTTENRDFWKEKLFSRRYKAEKNFYHGGSEYRRKMLHNPF